MIIPVAALVAVLLPLLLGGRLGRLADLRIRHLWLIFAALGTQILIIELISPPLGIARAIHIGTYAMAGAFLFVNRNVPGMLLMGSGAAANGVTIALNGGVLPASAWATRVAGISETATGFINSGQVTHPHLAFLGDILPIPAALPLSNVISIGDLLLLAGLAYLALRVCGTRWTEPLNPAGGRPVPDPDGPARLASRFGNLR